MIAATAPTDLDSLRIRNEFLDMPGLSLSVSQVARMLGLRSEHAAAILETLVSEQFLTQAPAGSYQRATAVARGRTSLFS
jgi:DNA-binding IclR family transcriptional regulator